MNRKELKKRILHGFAYPELFWMPIGQKEKTTEAIKINCSSKIYRANTKTNERSIYGWENYARYNIKGIKDATASITNGRGNILINNETIGEITSQSEVYNGDRTQPYYDEIKFNIETNRGNVSYCGTGAYCSSSGKSSFYSCIECAEPSCSFSLNGTEQSFNLLNIYGNYLENIISSNSFKGYLEWAVFYDCSANVVKSSLYVDENINVSAAFGSPAKFWEKAYNGEYDSKIIFDFNA